MAVISEAVALAIPAVVEIVAGERIIGQPSPPILQPALSQVTLWDGSPGASARPSPKTRQIRTPAVAATL